MQPRNNNSDALSVLGQARQDFLVRYSPGTLAEIAANPNAYADAPNVEEVNAKYGSNTLAMWVALQLGDVNKTSGAKIKMDETQLEWTAQALTDEILAYHRNTEFPVLITDAAQFFWRLKKQKYERFYGAIDPDVILRCFAKYKAQRDYADEYRRADELERRHAEQAARAVTYKRYLEMKAEAKKSRVATIEDIRAIIAQAKGKTPADAK